ncbi:hypothetical protein [Flavobacterium sp. HSC-61S13]|uniref:hypothetical protein n=1 Tax=Flavobacterium sp. HSC-61S13 TaxID=2910963 RepID=UPI00209D4586|nr:hypothetical protein [Flavobacterium sp. HSC-61S13]MCP1994629.1 hypothetical protein [Flavobacterium sp. HSC-61S13]
MKQILPLIISFFFIVSFTTKSDSLSENKKSNSKTLISKKADTLNNNASNQVNKNEYNNLGLFFEIITAVGSIATFGSFIFLFRRDKDKQAQIDELTNIVSTLTSLKDIENQKLNLSIRPDINLNGSGYQGTDGEWHLGIENTGEKTTLTKLELISDGLILHNEHIPFVMEKKSTRKIFARTNTTKHVKDCKFELKIYHTDKIGNLHIVIFKGIGSTVRERETINCA